MGVPMPNLHGTPKCACLRRLSFKTVDSSIGKLRSIFKELGRCGEWNTILGFGNPANSLEVQRYLKASTGPTLPSQTALARTILE